MRASYLALLFAAIAAGQPAGIVKMLHVRIPMRDGVHLAANVYRPPDHRRVPAILVRTPYGKGADITPHYEAFVKHGYAVVLEDVRGRYQSEGTFEPLEQEPLDGDDSINWIARQPWSDGKVGMIGGSYLGIAQWKAAIVNNPHLKAIFPVVSGWDDYLDRFYSHGGAVKLGQRLLWMSENLKVSGFHPDFSRFVLHLPLRTADVAATGRRSAMYQKAIAHPAYDSFWQRISTRMQIAKVRIPVFAVGGWYDNFVQSDLEAYAALHKSSGLNRILIGPWPHNMSVRFANVDFGGDSTVPIRSLQFQWFDQWLKSQDTPVVSKPPVRVFVMGANRWREDREWPPEGVKYKPFYLDSKRGANTASGDGRLVGKPSGKSTIDVYTYDPRNPVPTVGGPVCCNPNVFPWGPKDQRELERRRDVLVYSSGPLRSDVEVTGPIRVVLYASTSAKDTDFTAKLVDVFPDGEACILTDGVLRLRYRKSLEKADLAKPGEVYRLIVDAGVTSNLFRKGHRIRIEISSSNFPRFDRNPNTGGSIADETRLAKASQMVFHDKLRPSHVLLPVIAP